jgi:hypothetical protein
LEASTGDDERGRWAVAASEVVRSLPRPGTLWRAVCACSMRRAVAVTRGSASARAVQKIVREEYRFMGRLRSS